MIAVRQYDGRGNLEGCYVLEQGPLKPPTIRFKNQFRQIEAETLLSGTDVNEGFTWADALRKLVEDQNYRTTMREGPFDTELSAEELLEQSPQRA